MKIYTINNGWRGALVVVAESKEEARKIAVNTGTYNTPASEEEFEEHEITKGVFLDCAGDQ